MKNKLKIISASVLILSAAFSVFTSCGSDKTETVTTAEAKEITAATTATTAIQATDYTYNTITAIIETETEYVHTVPPVPTEKDKKEETENQTQKQSSDKNETTKKASSGGKVDEESYGLNIITKTSPVSKGNTATVIIQGTPGAEYSIQFFKTATEPASYEGLEKIKADSAGFASWTFMIEDDCESGNRKVLIKEKNSDKYIQTSITVQ